MRRPAGRILEQPNRTNAPIGAKIKPVVRAARYANQIASLDFNREHRARSRVNVKQSAALDDEADFVLVVPVLTVELVEHDVEVRRVRKHVDHVCCYVSALGLEL